MSFLNKVKTILGLVGVIWLVYFASLVFPLRGFGIVPRTLDGLVGILAAPFLHANLPHITANTTALMTFGGILILLEGKRFWGVLVAVTIITGSLTWLMARPANHIGASGVIFGLFGYLLAIGLFRKQFKYILVSIGVGVVYGGFIFGVLPTGGGISWESHLAGLVAGGVLAKANG